MAVRTVEPGGKWKCECGKKETLGVYISAHWRNELVHTCSACGRKHSVLMGRIELIEGDKSMKDYSKMSIEELREELLTSLMAFYEADPTDAIDALRDILADGSTGIPVNQMEKEALIKELIERASKQKAH